MVFHWLRERETVQRLMEEVSGGRMHYMFNRVGGLKEDLPAGWTGRVRQIEQLAALLLSSELALGTAGLPAAVLISFKALMAVSTKTP